MIDQEKTHKQCLSINQKKRINGLKQLEYNFSLLPDKQKAWEYLIELTTDHDWDVRIEAAYALSSVYSHVPNKQKAWGDLIRLTANQDLTIKSRVASALGSAFPQVPDKQKAWEDLHRLTSDQGVFSRGEAAYVLCSNFSLLPDKQKAWDDLHKLTLDQDWFVRMWIASSLGPAFFHIPDKQKAWEDFIRLAFDEYKDVRSGAVYSLSSAFSHMPDKQKAWKDLHRLTSVQDAHVRNQVASIIGFSFTHIPDKQQAWEDLIRLTADPEWHVRREATSALGSCFSHVPDKQQAWNDLHRLTYNEDIWVKVFANHSLGKFSIFKASQAENEDNYKKELEKAIEFFEISAKELSDGMFNPSEFCLPFYRSFYTIIFKIQETKEEVDKYLAKAKDAIKGSKSKEILLEAIENLANALKEVQNLESLDLEAMKGELSFYRKYCDRAAELMRDTEETAPFATIAMRKGLPILDRNLRELLEEIQKKTEVIRDQTKGTPFEKLGDELNKESLSLLQVRDLVGFKKQVQNLENKLNFVCSKLPEGQKGEACELLKMIHEERSIEDKIPLINDVLSKFSYQLDMISCLNRIDESLSSINKKVEELILISRPGISEEVVISTGFQLAGSGFQHSITIPLQEISYAELQEDMEKIRGKTIDKLSKLPDRLAKKIKGYLLLNDKDEILDKLT